jgi:hypothetical protein
MVYKIKDLIACFGSLSITGAHAFRMVEAPIEALLFYDFFLSAELRINMRCLICFDLLISRAIFAPI